MEGGGGSGPKRRNTSFGGGGFEPKMTSSVLAMGWTEMKYDYCTIFPEHKALKN